MRRLVFTLRTVRDVLFRAVARPSIVAWVALLWSAVILVRAHALYIRHPHGINIDEGYILALGQRLMEGSWLPYVDGVSHRGPMVYWAAAIVALFGDGWVPIRIAALLIFLVSLLFTFLAARAAGHLLAGAVGAVGTVIGTLLVLVPHDGMAFNGEPVLNLFVMPAFWCLACGVSQRD